MPTRRTTKATPMPKVTEVISSTRKQPRDESVDVPVAKRAAATTGADTSAPEAMPDWAPILCASRERLESFNSDVSDELDQIDREMAAEEAAAANAITKRRLSGAGSEGGAIRTFEVDHVCEELYEKLEEDVMLDILADLQNEYLADSLPVAKNAPVVATTVASAIASTEAKKDAAAAAAKATPSTCASSEHLLWDVVATPAMMRAFSATVANSAVVKAT